MKIKDIVEGQIWQGVKQVGSGLGNIAGGVGMGALRALDRIGGGTGEVGTAAQIAARKGAQRAKQAKQISAAMPAEATAEFIQLLNKEGINIDDARSFNPPMVGKYMANYAFDHFASDLDKESQQYFRSAIAHIPVPAALNSKTTLDYMKRINQIRDDIVGHTKLSAAEYDPAAIAKAERAAELKRLKKEVETEKEKERLRAATSNDYDQSTSNIAKALVSKGVVTPGTQDQEPEIELGPKEKLRDKNAKPLYTVVAPGGERITKYSDGLWVDDNGEYIGQPGDIKQLEKLASASKYSKQSNIPKSKMPQQTWQAQKTAQRKAAAAKRMGKLPRRRGSK